MKNFGNINFSASNMGDLFENIKNAASLDNLLLKTMQLPLAKIDRAELLRRELCKYYPEAVIEEAIRTNPAKAGISRECIDQIAENVIRNETIRVTSASMSTSFFGGCAAVGAAVADLGSNFVFLERVLQELAYLYGFGPFNLNMDAETMKFFHIGIGVMFGVKETSDVLTSIANNVALNLNKRALAKGAVYPVVKKIAAKAGLRMTKQMFRDAVASVIPVAGSVLSGALTAVSFKPCCDKLKKSLSQSFLSDPEYYRTGASVDMEQAETADAEKPVPAEKPETIITVCGDALANLFGQMQSSYDLFAPEA